MGWLDGLLARTRAHVECTEASSSYIPANNLLNGSSSQDSGPRVNHTDRQRRKGVRKLFGKWDEERRH